MEAEVPTVEAKPQRTSATLPTPSSVAHNVQAGTASGSQVVVVDISKKIRRARRLGVRGCS